MQWERLGPYRLEERIGRGGMGVVYSAVTDVTGERTAVKVLLSHGDDDGFHDRFAAEIESLRMLRHPNIVRILGYGEEHDCRYYVMELVDGLSLQEMLENGDRFSWQQAVRIGVQICRALKHAHDHGIVHRDIKPANLLLTRDGVVKLSDFGIAKLFGNSGQTADGGVIGTAEYMSPEQADGRPATQRSDLYSLGGVLYALLAGRPPFRAKNLVEMLQLQRFADPEPVIRLNPAVPRALNDLVTQLLHKDPAKRVPTALVVGRQLESMLAYDQAKSGQNRADENYPATPRDAAGDRPANVTQDAPGSDRSAASADMEFELGRAGANDVPASDVELAEPPANRMTADFRVAPPAARLPVREPRDAKPVDRTMGVAPARVYTPIATDRRSNVAIDDEPAPWVSPGVWGLAISMITIGLLAWYWLQPPSAEKLYTAVKEAAEEGKVERLITVESEIQKFIDHYPADRRIREMQSYQDEIELYRLERRFEFRAKFFSKNDELSPIERMYFEAMGRIPVDPADGRRKLQAMIDLFRDSKDDSKQARECLQLAQKQLDRLDRRLTEQATTDRRLVEQKLADAARLETTDPEAARRIRAALDELYGDQAWAVPLLKSQATRRPTVVAP